MRNFFTPEIIGIITTVVVGILIRLIDHYFPELKVRALYYGTIKVSDTPEKRTYSLEVDGDPADIADKDEVKFRVEKPPDEE